MLRVWLGEARNSQAAFIAKALLGLVAERTKLVCILRIRASFEIGASKAASFVAFKERDGSLPINLAVFDSKMGRTRG